VRTMTAVATATRLLRGRGRAVWGTAMTSLPVGGEELKHGETF
jgi:hypothetical protein